MAREQELKLAVAESSWPGIHDWLKGLEAVPVPRQWLSNTYYDTPGADLNRQRVALRVRRSDTEIVQTLKTKGSAVNGVHDRQEWDWPLSVPELDKALLQDTPVGELVAREPLNPVFTTNFERRAWLWQGDDQEIEIACDRGEAASGNAQVGISEVELELKVGRVSGLVEQAQALSRICPVFLNPVSKAEQGYFLGGLFQPVPVELPAAASRSKVIDAWFQALGYFALTGQGIFLRQAVVALERLVLAQSLPAPLPTPEAFAELLSYLRTFTPGTPAQARAQLTCYPLLGQLQLALVAE